MNNDVSKDIRNTLWYVLVPLLRNGITFLTLPILTRYLTPADYGKAGLITSTAAVFYAVCSMGILGATYRFFFKYQHDNGMLRRLISTNVIYLVAANGIVTALLFLLFPWAGPWVFKGEVPVQWFLLGYGQVSLLDFNVGLQMLHQARRDGYLWIRNELLALVVQTLLGLGLVFWTGLRFEAIILAGLLGETSRAIALIWQHRRNLGWNFDRQLFRESFHFAWPTSINSLLGLGFGFLNRFLLISARNAAAVGIFEMGSKISLIQKMATDSVAGSFGPFAMKNLSTYSDEADRRFARGYTLVTVLLLFFSGTVAMFSREIVQILLSREFQGTVSIIPILILSQTVGVIGMLCHGVISCQNHMFLFIPANVAVFVASLGGNLLLVPKMGVVGSAIAPLMGALAGQVVLLATEKRFRSLPLEWKKLGMIWAGYLILLGFPFALSSYLPQGLWSAIAVKSLILTVWLASLFGFKIVKGADVSKTCEAFPMFLTLKRWVTIRTGPLE